METLKHSAPSDHFDVKAAFSRNIGWLTLEEQEKLSQIRVGIAGIGGVGGHYAEALARLGVHHFAIADHDQFEPENTNRQNECRVSNYGKSKADVISSLILDINPLATVKVFCDGVNESNLEDFCSQIDIFLDGLDFFELEIRSKIFCRLRELGKTAVTAAPFGTGCSCIVFTPKSMSFEKYFGLTTAKTDRDRQIRFLIGLSPSLLQKKYLIRQEKLNLDAQKAPSLPMGPYLCASVAVTTAMKLILQRGRVQIAPWSLHYDPYLGKMKKKYIWGGHKNPLQALRFWLAGRSFR